MDVLPAIHPLDGRTAYHPPLLQVVTAECGDKRDPGYWSTSRMLLEAGLCLALQGKECSEASCLAGGVLTPATAMGMVLVQRLRDAGFKYEVTGTATSPQL